MTEIKEEKKKEKKKEIQGYRYKHLCYISVDSRVDSARERERKIKRRNEKERKKNGRYEAKIIMKFEIESIEKGQKIWKMIDRKNHRKGERKRYIYVHNNTCISYLLIPGLISIEGQGGIILRLI